MPYNLVSEISPMPELTTSVAMTTYNGGAYLREQLDSLAVQSLPPGELVVCDDGSSDDTLEILEEFRARVAFPVEIRRNEQRLGYAGNFAKAIGLCKGDVVFPCDQDDVWKEARIRRHMDVYEAEPDVGMVYNNAGFIDGETRPLPGALFDLNFARYPRLAQTFESDRAFTILTPNWKIYGSMTSFRRKYWEFIAPLPEGLGHDDWVAICLSLLSRLRLIHDHLNDYRKHQSQVTKGSDDPSASVRIFTRLMEQRAAELVRIKERLAKLEASGAPLRFPQHQAYLGELISHLWRRCSMPDSRLRRAPSILAELLLGNYARFNDNWRDALSQDVHQWRFR